MIPRDWFNSIRSLISYFLKPIIMKIALIASLMMLIISVADAQDKHIKIIFDITSKDTITQQTVVRHVAGMVKSYPNVELEVVIYGGALAMALKSQSTIKSAMATLSNKPNISFLVCESAMRRHGITKDMLLETMDTVPDAIMEIAVKQAEGWSYIKEVEY